MMTSLRCAVLLGAMGIAVLACTAGSGTAGTTNTTPQKQAQVTSPTSGVLVTATISAVTLGDECAATTTSGDFAACDAGGGGAPAGDAAKAPGACGGSYCQQSNVQIAFTSGTGTQNAKVEIVSVTLLEAATGKVVDTLKASHPQLWNGSTYAAWDQAIKPASELKASYDLTAPAWSTLSGTSDARGTSAYSTQYKLNVTLSIDGVEITLESTDLSREPPVAT